jgi:hypothetical protein
VTSCEPEDSLAAFASPAELADSILKRSRIAGRDTFLNGFWIFDPYDSSLHSSGSQSDSECDFLRWNLRETAKMSLRFHTDCSKGPGGDIVFYAIPVKVSGLSLEYALCTFLQYNRRCDPIPRLGMLANQCTRIFDELYASPGKRDEPDPAAEKSPEVQYCLQVYTPYLPIKVP